MQHRNLEPLSNKRVNRALGEIVYSGPGLKRFVRCLLSLSRLQASLFTLTLQFLWLSCIQMAVPFQQGPSLVVCGVAGRNQPSCYLGIFHAFHLNGSDKTNDFLGGYFRTKPPLFSKQHILSL